MTEPTKCPTCGSYSRGQLFCSRRHSEAPYNLPHTPQLPDCLKCNDPWHGPAADAPPAEPSEKDRLIEQLCRDLNGAHDEIIRMQGSADPQKYDWPEWTPQANSIRWAEKVLGKRLAKTTAWSLFGEPRQPAPPAAFTGHDGQTYQLGTTGGTYESQPAPESMYPNMGWCNSLKEPAPEFESLIEERLALEIKVSQLQQELDDVKRTGLATQLALKAVEARAERAHTQGRLDQFLRMKKERPLDPCYWDMHEEDELRASLKPAAAKGGTE